MFCKLYLTGIESSVGCCTQTTFMVSVQHSYCLYLSRDLINLQLLNSRLQYRGPLPEIVFTTGSNKRSPLKPRASVLPSELERTSLLSGDVNSAYQPRPLCNFNKHEIIKFGYGIARGVDGRIHIST